MTPDNRRWIVAVLVGTCAAGVPGGAAPPSQHTVAARDASDPPAVTKPLIAHWTFDDATPGAVRDAGGKGNDASPAGGRKGLTTTRGVFGRAMRFSGTHSLQIPGKPDFSAARHISLSAWVRPTDLKVYREIFRKEDGVHRVLFSFQNDGRILSLGLNIGGYVECDARIDPASVLDGGWHHCAATFDGRVMRVYVDGREVGSLARPGRIDAKGKAPGCIGSSNGRECFQGDMDDLRIYSEAVTAEEIALLYRQGLKALSKQTAQLEKELRTVYVPRETFAETLAAAREKLAAKPAPLRLDFARSIVPLVRRRFPEAYRDFSAWAGMTPLQFLTADSDRALLQAEGRLMVLLVEYRPLTSQQWSQQTPEQLRGWKEVEAIESKHRELVALGEEARFSPDWIDVILDAGKRIQFRPVVQEAVAPYVTPSTPETRDLSADEARAALERDWLHQADGKPTRDRIGKEIVWTRQLAARIRRNAPDAVDFAAELRKLQALETQVSSLTGPSRDLYFKVRELKRAIAFRNPVVDFDKVLFVDMPFPQGKEWKHETRHRLGYMAVPGARLMTLQGLGPAGTLTQLMPRSPLHGSFWRPDLSFDAKKVLFCFKPHNEKSFHLYEINVDGSGFRQLTDGPFDDMDPIYLPDGKHIAFSTTRGHTYVRCMPPTNAYVLARCDADGRNIYLTSRNNEPDYLPSVLNDGRIIYTRWEYTDKPLWRAQGLWTVNPDGTQVNTFWGNQSVWPDLLKDARQIPGSRRVMFTGSAHHNWFSGSVGIIDPDAGFNFPAGLTKVTADVPWPECGNGPTDPVEAPDYHASGKYPAYYSPYPLGEEDFLVSASRGGKFVLYLMDVRGNRELLYEGVHNILHALPLRPRPRPPVLADRVDWPTSKQRLSPPDGVLYSYDVYHGVPRELRDKAKYLRVLSIDHKTYTYWHKRPYISTGPVVSLVQSDGVKRILGTVPIERDGSVSFRVPAGLPLHFQLLDGKYRALQTMRSFTGVMPGEQRGCLGCHELHSTTPQVESLSTALTGKPSSITPPPWGEDTVSYTRYVQPVLDQYCGKCHQKEGKGRKKLDLTRRPGFLLFDEPYVTLTGKPTWGKSYRVPTPVPPGWGIAGMIMVESYDKKDPAAYRTPKPMTRLSYRSKLIEIASSGKHNDVTVDPVSLRKLIAWVDTMCPYRGDEEVRQIPDPVFQGVGWLAIPPRIRTAPRIVRPGPVD